MSATASFIMFFIFCLTLAASYGAGYAARAMRDKYLLKDAQELFRRNEQVLKQVEPI